MKRSITLSLLLLTIFAATAAADWTTVAPGVSYQHFHDGAMDIHVSRVDLTSEAIRVMVTRESDEGLRVSDFAKKNNAVVAINGDYFDKSMRPVGLSVGDCGPWADSHDTGREGVVAVGGDKAAIYTQSAVMDPPDPWITAAISGWPMLVRDCHALTSAELPGSDAFTRSPHARTALGLSADGRTLYLVVADGRRADAPGLTLGQLGAWMQQQLGVCAAINLDGGGSTAMWVGDRIVNRPSDGSERRVGNHLAVVLARDFVACDSSVEQRLIAANAAGSHVATTGMTSNSQQQQAPSQQQQAPPAAAPAATSTAPR